jgi:DNA primase
MARLPDSYIDSLVAATDIVSVIGNSIKLKKSGEQFLGKCPFHSDSSPSFSVHPGKKVYLCRGCNATGNVINFVQDFENIGFREVVEKLAKAANMPIPRNNAEQMHFEKQQGEILSVLERAQSLYVEELKKAPEALEYLRGRGLDDDTIARFGIGYAPTGGKFLLSSMPGVTEDLLARAGLSRKSEFHNGEMQDWMKYRITFPIRSASGRVIAFGGRTMVKDQKSRKYINTPETMVFKKGNELYGYFEAAADIRKRNTVYVAEGYLDSVIPSGHGVRNIVSAMGTALTPMAIERLFKVAETIVFCFDGDDAGRLAAYRAMANSASLIDSMHSVRFAFLPDGVDPDEYVIAHGAPAFEKLVGENSVPLSKYIISQFSRNNDLSSAEGKARFASQCMDIVNLIKDPMLRGLISDEVRTAAGAGVAVPGVNAPANAPLVLQEPVRRRGFQNLREKSFSNAPSSAAHKNNAPIVVAPPSEEDLMRPATQIMSIFVLKPQFAAFFEADWLMLVNSSDEEIAAVTKMVDVVNQHNAKNSNPSEDVTVNITLMEPAAFAAALSTPDMAVFMARANALAKIKEGCDLELDFSNTVAHLSKKQARLNAMNLIKQRRP